MGKVAVLFARADSNYKNIAGCDVFDIERNALNSNQVDEFGGWTLPIYQCNFGHSAEKPTFLYIVGVSPDAMPLMPILPGKEACIIGSHGRRSDGSRLQPGEYGYRKACFRPDREHTPPELCAWLFDVANRCRVGAVNHV